MTEDQAVELCEQLSERINKQVSGAVVELAERVPDDLLVTSVFAVLIDAYINIAGVWASMGMTMADESGREREVTFQQALQDYADAHPEDFVFEELFVHVQQQAVTH